MVEELMEVKETTVVEQSDTTVQPDELSVPEREEIVHDCEYPEGVRTTMSVIDMTVDDNKYRVVVRVPLFDELVPTRKKWEAKEGVVYTDVEGVEYQGWTYSNHIVGVAHRLTINAKVGQWLRNDARAGVIVLDKLPTTLQAWEARMTPTEPKQRTDPRAKKLFLQGFKNYLKHLAEAKNRNYQDLVGWFFRPVQQPKTLAAQGEESLGHIAKIVEGYRNSEHFGNGHEERDFVAELLESIEAAKIVRKNTDIDSLLS